MRTTVERIATWAAGLRLEHVPPEVVELSRAQRASVLGAIAGSARDEAAERVIDAVLTQAAEGPAPVPGRDRTARVEDAVMAASAASIALDFDDYGLFGHSGHSWGEERTARLERAIAEDDAQLHRLLR